MQKVAIVTGCSSGIGFSVALGLAREGYFTYASMRDISKGTKLEEIAKTQNLNLKVIEINVTKQSTIDDAINIIKNEKGRIDILVNNAGSSLIGSCEDISIEEYQEQFDTNFFGALRMMKSVIPIMRNQKSGRIINISAILGRTGMALLSGFVCTKFALEGLTECLRHELSSFGIKSTLIEPGTVNTQLHKNMKIASKSNGSIYREITEKSVKQSKILFEKGMDPMEVTEKVLESLRTEDPLPRYPAGEISNLFTEEMKRRSETDFEKYVSQVYSEVMNFQK